ncbi:hypothetical protein OHA72_43815 [Dactylosporangium sp. NBC_01737]|uniref:hypothetical protein n=1 Tax=Dactylosporangium sp. NBC_01737 TaxID=2975959 RepID=UPI002E0EB04D|nr:hypothetical protein OHA72_43815 [Dactylosporangium sp. NBC_01737]
MADDARNKFTVWRILIIVGLGCNLIGLVGSVPILSLFGGLLTIGGLIGWLVARSKAKAEEAAAAARRSNRRRNSR